MKNFLQLLEPQIPASQAEQIAAIVLQKQRRGEIGSTQELSQEVQRLMQLVRRTGTFQPALRFRDITDPRSVMEGEYFNALMEALDFDLRTLYEILNQQTGTALSLKRVLRSQLESLRAGICRLADDVIAQRLQKANQFARVITQGFADGRNRTTSGRPAVVDPQTRALKLDARSRQRYHQRRGINPAQVEIRQLSGGLSGVSSRTFAPENAIDPDTESFWADVLLADSPIQTDYTFLDGSTQTYDGALAEIELVLGASEFVTDVKILPFGDFPVDIIDVKIRQGTNYFQYPGFVDRSPRLDWLEWHGPRIQADAVVFVLQQANYSRVRLHLPAAALEIASFWEQLLDEESRLVLEDTALTALQQQRAEADSRYNSLWEGLRRYGIELQRLDLPQAGGDPTVFPEDELLRREVNAAVTTMFGTEQVEDPAADQLRSEDVPERPALVEVEKVEYVFGAREVQANDVNYVNAGHYASPKYAADATLLEVRLNTVEEHPVFNTGDGDYRQTSVEYEVELAEGRRAPLLPKGATEVTNELLEIDRTTRQDTTRIPALNTTVTIRRGGDLLDATAYTIEQLTSGHLRVTIAKTAFFRSARYSITYTPAVDQDVLKVSDLFDSVLLAEPEVFAGTDETGSIELAHFPYVEFSVVNDEARFRREAQRNARYLWIGGAEQLLLDGVLFGDVNTTLDGDLTAGATTISLTSVAGLSSAGTLKIETELITYTGISSNDLTGVTRGVNGTTAVSHADGTRIVGERSYEPVIVTVGNVRAFNISDYLSGRHPAFLAAQDDAVRYEYLHVGRRLFFNRPITNKPIAVRYRWMAQYLQVHAQLRSHTVGRVPQTPLLRQYHLEVASTVL